MAVINTNVKALFSQAALKLTERNQQVSMQQLSTGKRINSSRDDAAGMAIATRMTQQVRSLNQAVRNAGDAITLIQTAEGATNEITDMMQRMRELAIQASNDTNNNEQRSYLDLEFQQLKKQVVQIADNTEWNGFPVLNGSTGERVGIKPVYKTTSEPTVAEDIVVTAGIPTTSSTTVLDNKLNESAAVTFQPLTLGQSVTVGGLTLTATGAVTAIEAAAAFKSLAAGTAAASVPAGQITNATMSGTLTGFSTAATTTAALTFTSASTYTNVTDLVYTTTGTALSVTNTDGRTGLGVTESSVLTFPAMSKGQTITVAGLTYTATVANSGAEVAEAFANIAASATTGSSTKGTYSGTLTAFSSGPKNASSDVTFTSTTRFATATDIAVSSNTTVSGGQIALSPTVSTPAAKQGAAGGGIYLGGAGAFAKSGSLSVVAGGATSVTSATFTLDDGQILDLNVNSAVTITGGIVTINKTLLERAGINILSGGDVTLTQKNLCRRRRRLRLWRRGGPDSGPRPA